ncbi:hypothetical protein [Nocardioides daeguensis]|uniref:Uncharacterized protein n=1 Tax=Nocardioides daeguensis TaxID=908359 RepID=A0ABP6VTK4_9ACTN|nr:hypothetical protein [Nocardioides daeguensis]MBV6728558.1 hypothetical protein [Nocardioides daeguensis]MCR1773982.1 hypothetical protein [Nocardioides daeguensis]
MSNVDGTIVPVWTLSTTQGATVPAFADEGALTPERLTELRSALAAFASAPLVTLEAHPLPAKRDRASSGLPLDAMSPLAKELSRLVSGSSKSPAVQQVTQSTEVLYRMHVPAKVASQFGKGLVKPMTSKAVDGGVYGDLVAGAGKSAIAAKATFVPVEAASAGATGTAVGAAAGTAAAGTAMTVAAPLVLMAVAVGASAYADHERQKAIENITELLEKLHDDKLEAERSELDGCRDAIDKATALLLDRGKVGSSLGLDSAVHAISTASQRAETRVKKWEAALDSVLEDDHVDVAEVDAAFPGISEEGGEFRAHLEMAALAIALKRRVIVLQGVEAGQSDQDNPFENFVQSLRADQQRINELEARIENVLRRLSSLELRSPKRLIDKVMTRKQVDSLLDASYRLRALAPAESNAAADVVIEIEKHQDGTLLVLPARAS